MDNTATVPNNKSSLISCAGLSAFQLKVIALIIMTIDHIGAFAYDIPIVAKYQVYLRLTGRLAMPIFLFLLVQSIRYTRDKKRFVMRLYLAGMSTELFVTAMNLLLGERLSYFFPGNILFSFFYVALYTVLVESIGKCFTEHNWRGISLCMLSLALSALPTILYKPLQSALEICCPASTTVKINHLASGLLDSFLPSIFSVDYGPGIIILGVVLYFARTKKRQCIVFTMFCAVCCGITLAESVLSSNFLMVIQSLDPVRVFCNPLQIQMIWALPLLILYNGERGCPSKYFFYVYYPVHREVIFLISKIFTS